MAEKIRTKSDSLWRLVKTLTDSTVETLRRQTEVLGRDEEKFKLVAFYRGQPVYDREQEKAAWENNTTYLKVLKYRTYAWLVSQLAVISTFPHDDVHRLIGEIKVQMYHGCYPDVLEYIDKAKTICKERELFYQWREILHLEIKAASKSLQASDLLSRIAGIKDAINELDEKIEDLERWDDVKMDYELQLKARHEENSFFDEDLFRDYRAFMERAIRTIQFRSKVQFLYHSLNLQIYSNYYKQENTDPKLHKEQARVLRNLFEQHTWMKDEDIEEYASLLMRVVGYVADANDRTEALEILRHIQNLDNHDELTTILAVDKVILAFFFLERCLGDWKEGARASELFLSQRLMLKNKLKPILYLWITFYYSTFFIRNCDFRDQVSIGVCKGIIDDVLSMKIKAKIDIQSHLKTIKVICDFLTNESYSGFGVSCKSAVRHLRSIETNTEVQMLVIERMDSISKIISDREPCKALWETTLEELIKLRSSPDHVMIFDFFDYLAFWEKMQIFVE